MTGLFKVFGIIDTNIVIDLGNGLVTFWNTHVRLYNCQIKEIDISHPKMANSLVKILTDKSANEEILIPFDYLEPKRPCQRGRLQKSLFTNDFIDKIVTIFISYRKQTDYELAF